MTDEAITASAEAAPMPAIDTASPAEQSSAPEPIQRSEPTARGAIDRAFAAIEQRDKAPAEAVADKPVEATGERPRNSDGTFATKDAQKPVEATIEGQDKPKAPETQVGFAEAPSRFSADAKAAWATAPEPVRAETMRAIRELEGGIKQYQEQYEPYREFDKSLKASGQTFQQVFQHYTGIENMLAQDLTRGLDVICQNAGTSLREIAAQIAGQPQDEGNALQERTINELRRELSTLKQELTGVSTSLKADKETSVFNAITEFSTRPEYGRFEELGADIALFLQTRLSPKVETARRTGKFDEVLQEAYQLAERLNPAPQAPAPVSAAPAAQPQATAQTRKGQLSLSGAPSSGSNPANRKPPSSPREALDRAFANVGL